MASTALTVIILINKFEVTPLKWRKNHGTKSNNL